MTWLPLLLADRSPNLRYLVLKNLLQRDLEDDEVKELISLREEDPIVQNLLALQTDEGYWTKGDFVSGAHSTKILATTQALVRLAYLGYDKTYSPIRKGAEYLFSFQNDDGSWPLPVDREKKMNEDGYEKMTIQTALPLRALALSGYSTDSRSKKAYKWILEQRMDDGAWPTGYVKGNFGYVAGYRKIAHSRWGCRSNTTAALSCLAAHPKYCSSEEAKRALDLLLGRDTKERIVLGFEVARSIGFEQATGFITYFARYDTSLMLKLCTQIGASIADSRVRSLMDFIQSQQTDYGVWNYLPKPQASRWVTYDILHSLTKLDDNEEWVSFEPHTPFQPYPKKHRRF